MNRDEAKRALLLYRPGGPEAEDAEVLRALEAARQDPELGRWLEQHLEFQRAMQSKLRQIEAPAHLRLRLLAGNKVVTPAAWWSRPSLRWLAAAAALALLIGLAALWHRPAATNRFARFEERMVSRAIREYAMEWETADMAQLRRSMASRGGPSDYDVPKGLEGLKLTGGGVLPWQSKPVSMACFDRGGGRMLFLFVIKRTALKDPPPPRPARLALVHDWMAASWTQGDNIYLLTGSPEKSLDLFRSKYL